MVFPWDVCDVVQFNWLHRDLFHMCNLYGVLSLASTGNDVILRHYFPYPECAISFGTLQCQTQSDEMVRSLTPRCVVKIPALTRMSSCFPVAPVKDQSDLGLSMSFTKDNNSTSFNDFLWSGQS